MKTLILTAVTALFVTSAALAAPIRNVAPTLVDGGFGSISYVAGTPESAGNLTTVVETDLETGDPAVPNNTIELNLDFTSTGTMTAQFLTTAALTGPANTRVHIYKFNVNITNSLLSGKEIPTFDVFLNSGTGSVQFLNDPDGNAGGNGYNAAGFEGSFLGGIHYIDANNIRFGGLGGGGGGISNGGNTTVSFLLQSNAGAAGNFTLSFTASPEPTSMALAGAALCGFGGVVARRRRNKKNA